MKHRRPPLPESMKGRAVKGMCRWCGQSCHASVTWHPECVEQYKLLHWPAVTRKAVFLRDRGVCAKCNQDTETELKGRAAKYDYWTEKQRADYMADRTNGRAWQHDHIHPLFRAHGDLRHWRLDNIQTLCTACHKAKTKADAAAHRERTPK